VHVRPGKDPARVYGQRRRMLALVCFAALLGLIVLSARVESAGAEGEGALVVEPELSATAAGVRTLFGATPNESPGEVWGAGESGEKGYLVRYTEAGGWEAMPPPVDAEGKVVTVARNSIPESADAGRTTPAGGVVAVAELPSEDGSETQALLVRDPGGPVRAVPAPEAPILEEKETLYARSGQIKMTAIEEEGGSTGAFVAPSGASLEDEVLHYDGTVWSKEQICLDAPGEPCLKPTPGHFNVIAIEGSSPSNAWLLAKTPKQVGKKAEGQGIMLFKRIAAGEWRNVPLAGALGEAFEKEEGSVAGTKFFVEARQVGQSLTVSPAGVWIDANVRLGSIASTSPVPATIYYDLAKGEVTGSWCDLAEANIAVGQSLCTRPLGFELPSGESRSFAWAGNGGPGEEFGSRAITGVGRGAMLIFENGGFVRVPLDGNGGSKAGAALNGPDEGWLGPSLRLTRTAINSGLQSWPVPFRRPLTAIAPQPGATEGAIGSQALAVGVKGEIARYTPGIGWQPEVLLNGSGTRATPNLRAVAWPEPGFAYAVGDEGAMWMWRQGTGLWEPDPGAPPNLIRGNFTGIAFQPGEPARGYAVGKQGLLLAYGKRWTQEPLPTGVNPEANITGIAFAGSEAIATYMVLVKGANDKLTYTGGVMVNDGTGSGWQVEEEAAKVLEPAEAAGEGVAPRRLAALPDGGVVVVGATGGVIEREAAGAPWHVATNSPLGYPSAVAAIRESGQLRALVSVEEVQQSESAGRSELGTDVPQTIELQPGQPPVLTEPYPLSDNGFLVRQTANGWRDEQHQAVPLPQQGEGQTEYDMPRSSDAVLALLINPEGGEGWAVGGNTGGISGVPFPYQLEGIQTAAAMRYGAGAALPENSRPAPIATPGGAATFAIGGGAACAGPCADEADTGIGPEVWVRSAVEKAAGIAGLRAFLYTGGGVAEGDSEIEEKTGLPLLSPLGFGEEEAAYARRLGSAAAGLPVYATPSLTDRYPKKPLTQEGTLSIFAKRFEGFPEPLGSGPMPVERGIVAGEPAADPAENDSYWFESAGTGGENPVRVIVLDFSVAPLSAEKECWLANQLAEARAAGVPSIVLGNRAVGGETELQSILVTGQSSLCPEAEPGAASAYFYESEANRQEQLSWEGATIPTFGTGTLGYVRISDPGIDQHEPASGFLLAAVGSDLNERGVAPVTVSLIPNIASLAINATEGTFLRRSQTALFEALARRPVAGYLCQGNEAPDNCDGISPDPYVQIPDRCIRGFDNASCATEILPEYRFASSRPDIANFVEVDPAATNPKTVFLQDGKPVADEKSGLLCAFNAGTTTVTVETGALSYSIPVTVQAGSVAQPCGTVPLLEKPTTPPKPTVPPPPPLPSQHPHFRSPEATLPPPNPPAVQPPAPVQAPPTPSPPQVHHPIQPPVPLPLPFFPGQGGTIGPVPVIPPPPPAPSVEPTPPSGTSPVTQPAVSPEPEEEEEAAFDLVHHMAAYRHERARDAAFVSNDPGGAPSLRYFVPALALLLALAGVGIATPRRRTSKLAYETRATPRRPHR
jgi:hypothetical protein